VAVGELPLRGSGWTSLCQEPTPVAKRGMHWLVAFTKPCS
jgi:hypothetical protein